MLLLTGYQEIELIFAFVFFIPAFYLYYLIQGLPIDIINLLMTSLFVVIIILFKDIVVNYYNLIQETSINSSV